MNTLPIADTRARKIRQKLEALAAQGINGEKAAAEKKLKRHLARFDWETPDPTETPDIFAGVFKPEFYSRAVIRLDDFQAANAIKWAVERRTGIQCSFAGDELRAQATAETAGKLASIATTVATGFSDLWNQFERETMACAGDRSVFYMGLYDGMMGEEKSPGLLPTRPGARRKLKEGEFPPAFPVELQTFAAFNKAVEKKIEQDNGTVTWIRYFYKGKLVCQSAPDLNQVKLREAFYKLQAKQTRAMLKAPGLSVHPYTVATSLGKSIRFNVPLPDICNQLDRAIKGELCDQE